MFDERREAECAGRADAGRDLVGGFALSFAEELLHDPWTGGWVAPPIFVEAVLERFVDYGLELPRPQISGGVVVGPGR